MKHTIQYLLLFCITVNASASQDSTYFFWQKANAYYQKQQYQQALKIYTLIEKQKVISPELLYNIGNVHYKLHNIPMSIAYYHKHIKYYGNNSDIEHNLKILNSTLTDKTQISSEFNVRENLILCANIFNEKSWAIFSIILCVILCLLAYLLFSSNTILPRKSLFYSFTAILLSFIFSIWMGSIKVKNMNSLSKGVILSPTIEVKSEPNLNSKKLFIVHEGLVFNIKSISDEWINIRLTDGKEGWIPMDEAVLI